MQMLNTMYILLPVAGFCERDGERERESPFHTHTHTHRLIVLASQAIEREDWKTVMELCEEVCKTKRKHGHCFCSKLQLCEGTCVQSSLSVRACVCVESNTHTHTQSGWVGGWVGDGLAVGWVWGRLGGWCVWVGGCAPGRGNGATVAAAHVVLGNDERR